MSVWMRRGSSVPLEMGRARCLSYGSVQVTAYGVCLLPLEFAACRASKSDIELGYRQKIFLGKSVYIFKE